jgi:hypothetical protein
MTAGGVQAAGGVGRDPLGRGDRCGLARDGARSRESSHSKSLNDDHLSEIGWQESLLVLIRPS